ncbi:prenyltransferase UbiA [Gigaspora margarita]|uniref:Prenyltransferase UbiA n=1 Tax=Gigaspora margarita TaxID=4874 RepID=A0A8H3XBV6_GIGMA|nr:prenyltransferase UbiA [Gigaspora margarita]
MKYKTKASFFIFIKKILKTIRKEFFIIFLVSITDWSTAVIPPLLMTVGAFYMHFFSSVATSTYYFSFFEIIQKILLPRLFRVATYFLSFLISFNWFNQINDVEEDKLNKPFRPIPSGLVTVEGARYRLIAFNIFFPTISYLIGGLPLLISALLWQAWFVTHKVFNLSANALCKNCFSAFGAWIMFVVTSNLIIGTEFNVSKWWLCKPCPFHLSVVIFVLFTLQVQDFRDQKGDKLIGRKTLPLLIGDTICRWLTVLALILSALSLYGSARHFLLLPGSKKLNIPVPTEFIITEIALFVIILWTCVRLIKYRDSREDRCTYEIWYSGYYTMLCLYYGMAIGIFSNNI